MKYIFILMTTLINAIYSVDYQATCADDKLNIEVNGSFDGYIIIEDAHVFKERIIGSSGIPVGLIHF